ncbi:serine/threonine-protein kinase RUNKEL [Canna indica]|uniref:Serine/threonine-protein kinase RUNKEL n=1 Tax=Canna indica TaxID=4628 RepID=A0AAQ3KRG2_9LILI|nr:serine/threonine-protein kinase RUNKEL [Canna indica]
MMGGKRHGPLAALTGRGNPKTKSSAHVLPVILHLLGSSSFKHPVVNSHVLLQLANLIKILAMPFQGRDDFQISIIRVLELVIEEPSVILDDPRIFTGFNLKFHFLTVGHWDLRDVEGILDVRTSSKEQSYDGRFRCYRSQPCVSKRLTWDQVDQVDQVDLEALLAQAQVGLHFQAGLLVGALQLGGRYGGLDLVVSFPHVFTSYAVAAYFRSVVVPYLVDPWVLLDHLDLPFDAFWMKDEG